MSVSRPRLEGRALEHALANDRWPGVRVCYQGQWKTVMSQEALEARAYMKTRAKKLVEELRDRGLHARGADLAVQLAEDDAEALGSATRSTSVDLRIFDGTRSGFWLLEVKWTRRSMATSLTEARKSLPKLRAAATSGRWARGRKRVAAIAVGVLAGTPTSWRAEVKSLSGDWTADLSLDTTPPRAKRPSGWAAWRGSSEPGSDRWPSGPPGKRSGASGCVPGASNLPWWTPRTKQRR